MKPKPKIKLILVGAILLIFVKDMYPQINNWSDVVERAVFSYGEKGEWDDSQVWNPAVIKDDDTIRMYYTGGNDIVWESPKTKIGYAWSLDGINWTRHIGNPVLIAEYNWEDDHLFGCAVIKDNDTLKMWYGCGYPGPAIGYATSIDGKKWNKHHSPVLKCGPVYEWDDGFLVPTSVIKDGDLFKLWYWAGRPGWPEEKSMPQSGMATSKDGINWTKYNNPATSSPPFVQSDPVLKHGLKGDWDEDRAIAPMVLKKRSGYEMWYVGAKWYANQHSFGYAQSNDGVKWIKYPAPVFTSPRSWGNPIWGGTALYFDNNYHIWYACFHTELYAGPKIGYARAHILGISSQCIEVNIKFYPNPFSSSTTIEFFQMQFPVIQITIYNQLGKQVELIEENQLRGKQQIVWNAAGLPAGIYFCVLKTNQGMQTKKIIKL